LGAHPGAGRHPAGGSGQPGGVLKRHPDATGGPVRSVSIPAPVLPVTPKICSQAITNRQNATSTARPARQTECRVEEWVVKTALCAYQAHLTSADLLRLLRLGLISALDSRSDIEHPAVAQRGLAERLPQAARPSTTSAGAIVLRDQLACLSASRSRFRFCRSEVVGSVSTAEPAWRSSALPPNYVTVDHLEPVDADLLS
jgi:hypothetical protein